MRLWGPYRYPRVPFQTAFRPLMAAGEISKFGLIANRHVPGNCGVGAFCLRALMKLGTGAVSFFFREENCFGLTPSDPGQFWLRCALAG